MATMDIFRQDAFSMQSLLQALENVDYQPQFLGSLDLFEDEPQRVRAVSIEKRDNELKLIQTTPIGAPLPQLNPDLRSLRMFQTPRIAKGSTLQADDIQGIRAFGTESELQQVQVEIARRLARLTADVELTWEHMRLGAIQGVLLDADGSVIYDYFDEFGLTPPDEIEIDFAALSAGELRPIIEGIVRSIRRSAKGAVTTGTRIVALVGDDFWDALVNHEEVRTTYLNYQAAAALREATLYTTFRFAGVDWINYQGTDDNSTVAIATDEAKFFPVNAPGLFKVAWGPAEFLPRVNQPGVPILPLTLPDPSGREAFVTVEVYSYPLFICTRPQALRTAVMPS